MNSKEKATLYALSENPSLLEKVNVNPRIFTGKSREMLNEILRQFNESQSFSYDIAADKLGMKLSDLHGLYDGCYRWQEDRLVFVLQEIEREWLNKKILSATVKEADSLSKTGVTDDVAIGKIQRLFERREALDTLGQHKPEMIATVIADVEPRPVKWLWPGRIPLGKLTLLCGDPSTGKSYLSMWMAAHITRGTPWPDAPLEPLERGTVIAMTAEDGLADTVRIRAEAMGADLKKLVMLEGVSKAEGGDEFIDLTRHLEPLETLIKRHKDLKLVILDIVTDYLGSLKMNDFAATRAALTPVARLAERHNFALLGITHMNKDEAKRAVYRVMGSLSFIGVARATWLVTRDEDDETRQRRLFTPLKMNLAPDPGGLAFSINSSGVRFEEDTIITATADEQLGDRDTKDHYSAVNYAKEYLSTMVKDGPMLATALIKEAKAVGIKERTLRTAKSQLGIESLKTGDIWYWGFSQEAATPPLTSSKEKP